MFVHLIVLDGHALLSIILWELNITDFRAAVQNILFIQILFSTFNTWARYYYSINLFRRKYTVYFSL